MKSKIFQSIHCTDIPEYSIITINLNILESLVVRCSETPIAKIEIEETTPQLSTCRSLNPLKDERCFIVKGELLQ